MLDAGAITCGLCGGDFAAPNAGGEGEGPGRPRRALGRRPLDPTPGSVRSRFDAEARVVLYNDRHPDYLMVKDEESPLLDYLATLVAKESAHLADLAVAIDAAFARWDLSHLHMFELAGPDG
jgi:hypothetical protein